MDICIADTRLKLIGLLNNKLRVLDYTSDHDAIEIKIDLKNINNASLIELPVQHKKNFKQTKWLKFQNTLANKNIDIQNDRNLSNQEIDNYLDKLNLNISSTIEELVPNYKHTDSSKKYVNKRIKNLTNIKNSLISQYKKLQKLGNKNHAQVRLTITNYKEQIAWYTYEIKKEFSISCNNFWAKKAKDIDYKKPDTFFPELKKMFKFTEQQKITHLTIDTNNIYVIKKLNLDTIKLQIKNNKYIVTDNHDILNILATHYQKVNEKKYEDPNDPLTNIINNNFQQISQEIENINNNNITITKFSQNNNAINPDYINNQKIFFTTIDTKKIINKQNLLRSRRNTKYGHKKNYQ